MLWIFFYLLFNLMYYLCQLYPALILVITKNFIFSQKSFIIYSLTVFFSIFNTQGQIGLNCFIADNDFESLAYLKQWCQKYFMAMYLFFMKYPFRLTKDHRLFFLLTQNLDTVACSSKLFWGNFWIFEISHF